MLDRSEAIKLRKEGYSYGIISEKLGISKGTLCGWLRDIPYIPNSTVLKRVESGRGKYGLQRRQERLRQTQEMLLLGIEEVGTLSRRDLWMLGLGLWIGEGSKTTEQIRVVNSDPRLVRLYMRWLREVCELSDQNITVAMHLYPDSDETSCREYWQSITNLPATQFRKTQVDRRTNKQAAKIGKLLHGTLHITVVSNGDKDKGVKLYRKLLGWVTAVSESGAGEEDRTPVT